MSALVAMRVLGFVRSGRILAPVLAGLVVLAVLYGGGAAEAAEAYGFSAVVMFPVLAWQTKLLLDAEPDVQRRLAAVVLGSRRELTAGLVAAGLVGLLTVALALALPWLVGGIRGPEPGSDDLPLAVGLVLGFWAHLLALPAGVALGALASRAVTRGVLYGLTVLVSGAVLAIVLGLRGSVAPWAAPPLMSAARALAGQLDTAAVLVSTVHAALWTAVLLAAYTWLRRRRP